MNASGTDRAFAGSIPQLYDRHLVPLIFAPYATDIAARVAARRPSRVLEIAAGTGALTRELARALPADTAIVATDLNPPMLEQAAATGTARPVEWRQADAMELPFPDAAFDIVVCQFGVMFFPDKPIAMAEVRRVLRDGGTFVFNVWDRLEDNEFALVVTDALAALFPDDPPRFMARVPHGYHDPQRIADDLAAGGFVGPANFATITATSDARTPRIAAVAYCQGTPLRNEIEQRAAERLEEATDACTAALARRFGAGAIQGRIQALVASVAR